MAEYLAVAAQNVALNQAAVFEASIPCRAGNVAFENGTGVFVLRGNTCNCFARYAVDFNGNIALPEGGTPGPIAVAISVNGEARPSSLAISTPAAVEEFNNVTCTATIDVPKGCCAFVSLRHVPASTDPTVTPAPVITIQNGNFRIKRTA